MLWISNFGQSVRRFKKTNRVQLSSNDKFENISASENVWQ